MPAQDVNFYLIHRDKEAITRCGGWSFLPRHGDIISINEDIALKVTGVVINAAKTGGEVTMHSLEVYVESTAPIPPHSATESDFDEFVKVIKLPPSV